MEFFLRESATRSQCDARTRNDGLVGGRNRSRTVGAMQRMDRGLPRVSPKKLNELLAPSTTDGDARPIAQKHRALAWSIRAILADTLEIDDRRTMDANESRRIQS